jgi:hypothetical protein
MAVSPPRQRFAQALWPGVLLGALIAALAFALSFVALRDLGAAIGMGRLSWAYPLVIDSFLIEATWTAWRFKAEGIRGTWYPWAALVIFTGLSVVGNALHTRELALDWWATAVFRAVPPVALLIAVHLIVWVATHGRNHTPALVAATATGIALPGPDGPGGGAEVGPDPVWIEFDATPTPAPELAGESGPAITTRRLAAGPAGASASQAGPAGGTGQTAPPLVGRRLHLVSSTPPVPVVDVPDGLVAWVAAQVAAGADVNYSEAARLFPEAGSRSTVRRKIGALLAPGGLLAGPDQVAAVAGAGR